MAGGGDFGGGGGDLGGGGGGGKGAGDVGGGSPDMTGLGGPGGDMAFGGPPTWDTGNAWTEAGAPGAPGGGTFANTDPYISDPNLGAPQSQAPSPGTTPASIGGTQSDRGYPGGSQGYGGGSRTQQQDQSGQLGQALQQAVKLLQQGGKQDQGGGGGPSAASPTLSDLAQGQGFGGGSPTQQPTMADQPLGAQPVSTTAVSPDQQPSQAIPGSQSAPEAQNFGGQTAPAAPPASPAAGAGSEPTFRDFTYPQSSRPDQTAAPAAATSPAAIPAPSDHPAAGDPATIGPAPTPPESAGIQNPQNIIPDIIQGLLGTRSPMEQMAQQAGEQPRYPYGPQTAAALPGQPATQQGAQGAQGAQGVGQAVTPGSYPTLQQRIIPGRQLGPVNQGLQDSVAAAAQAFENDNPGYKVVVNNGHRSGQDPHGRNNAVDVHIEGPNGLIPNSGADRTGMYSKLAQYVQGAQRSLHPELNGKLGWGGFFNAEGGSGMANPQTGANHPDLMHFDVEGGAGRRGLMTQSYQRMGALGNYGREGAQRAQTAQGGMNIQPITDENYSRLANELETSGRGGPGGLGNFGADGPRYGIRTPADARNPQKVQEAYRQERADKGGAFQQQQGRPPTTAEQYVLHQQGKAGGLALYKYPNDRAVDVLSKFHGANAANVVTRNAGSPDMTAKQFTDMWEQRVNAKLREMGIQQPQTPQTPQGPQRLPPRLDMPNQRTAMMPFMSGVPMAPDDQASLAERYGLDWV